LQAASAAKHDACEHSDSISEGRRERTLYVFLGRRQRRSLWMNMQGDLFVSNITRCTRMNMSMRAARTHTMRACALAFSPCLCTAATCCKSPCQSTQNEEFSEFARAHTQTHRHARVRARKHHHTPRVAFPREIYEHFQQISNKDRYLSLSIARGGLSSDILDAKMCERLWDRNFRSPYLNDQMERFAGCEHV
jgi:hypothetical protein